MMIEEYDSHQDRSSNKHYQVITLEQLPQNRFIYLLIDGAAIKALPLIYTKNQQPEFELLYHGTPYPSFEEMLDISPVVIRLDNNKELQQRHHKWHYHAVAFTSTADLKTTANHLRSLILCKMPNTQPAFFRFYAHSWLYPLITEQPEETLYSFTGPIDQWLIPQPNKTWLSISIDRAGEPKTPLPEPWFVLTDELTQKLATFRYEQFISELTNSYTLSEPNTRNWDELREQITLYAKEAEAFGFEQIRHISQYVDLAIYHPNFTDSVAVQEILNKSETETLRLTLLKEHLNELNNQGESA